MKRISRIFPYILMVISGVSSLLVHFYKHMWEGNLTLISTVVSMIVSLLAYIIASNTYQSIDSVNVITQMDGNVLENEHYVTSMTKLLKKYDMSDSESLGNQIFRDLEKMFKQKKVTAIDFADKLQHFIDIIVFFPYLFKTKEGITEEHQQKMKKILSLIDKRKKHLSSIGTGNVILIEETVNLIKCIVNYQQLAYETDKTDVLTILDVRGSMLRNSVTQTVYYNYLGLFYNAKANHVLRKKFNLMNADFFSIDALTFLKNNIRLLTDEEKELYVLYLMEAKKAYQKALENGKGDMMWEGFIKFNEARATYLLNLVIDQYEKWLSLLDESIIARNRLNMLIKDVLVEETYLQKAFIFEGYLATLVKINILVAEDMNITDSFGEIKYPKPDYYGLLNDPIVKKPYDGNFDRIAEYQEKIIDSQNKIPVY